MYRKFLITEEWYEEDVKDFGRCESVATCYGQLTPKKIDSIVESMNKYSPFDYVDYQEFNTIEEYESHINRLKENGSQIKYMYN